MRRLIDANALFDDLKKSAKAAREWREGTQDEEIKIRAEQAHGTFVECALRVKNAPTIEAEPVRHAHWVFRDEDKHLIKDGCIPSNMWCSYCNQWSDNDCYGDAYCRNCGARMDEPDLADEIAKEVSEDAGND